MNPNIYPAVLLILAAVALAVYDFFQHTDKLSYWYEKIRRKGYHPSVYVPVILFEIAIWVYNIWRYKNGML